MASDNPSTNRTTPIAVNRIDISSPRSTVIGLGMRGGIVNRGIQDFTCYEKYI
jgi:hypothetical protein